MLTRNSAGRPTVFHTDTTPCSDLDVSISYATGVVAVAVACGTRCGVDIERVRALPDRGSLERRCRADDETSLTDDVSFLSLWTRKEATVKLTGTGLLVDPSHVSVLRPHEPVDRWSTARVYGHPV